jgi:EAL domain-containing protein (putative c-di-GMP-specific phosphodiesterase class I)
VLAVAHATINVIENLGMTSIAEGIEEPQVLAMLQSYRMPLRPGLLVCPAPAGRRLAQGHGCASRITGL